MQPFQEYYQEGGYLYFVKSSRSDSWFPKGGWRVTKNKKDIELKVDSHALQVLTDLKEYGSCISDRMTVSLVAGRIYRKYLEKYQKERCIFCKLIDCLANLLDIGTKAKIKATYDAIIYLNDPLY